MKKSTRKLTLNATTIRRLADDNLRVVNGGETKPSEDVSVCCFSQICTHTNCQLC